jgi:hypothetical protein
MNCVSLMTGTVQPKVLDLGSNPTTGDGPFAVATIAAAVTVRNPAGGAFCAAVTPLRNGGPGGSSLYL